MRAVLIATVSGDSHIGVGAGALRLPVSERADRVWLLLGAGAPCLTSIDPPCVVDKGCVVRARVSESELVIEAQLLVLVGLALADMAAAGLGLRPARRGRLTS